MIYCAPVAVFMASVLIGRRYQPDLRDPLVVREPHRTVWGPARWFRDTEWTEAGLLMRRQFMRTVALSLGLGVVTWVIVLTLAPVN